MTNTPSHSTSSRSRRPLLTTVTYYIIFVGLGLTVASLGPTISALAEQTQVSLSLISYLFTARSSGFIIGAFVIGRAYDRRAGHPVMTVMLVLIAAMMALVPAVSLIWQLIAIMVLIGIGLGSIDLGGNVLLIWLHQARVGPFMNGLHFIWGLGAFLAPILVALTKQSDDIRWAYWLLALLILPVTLWLPRLPSPRPGGEASEANGVPAQTPLLALVTVMFFLYVGAEVSMSGWIFTYTVKRDLTGESQAAYLNSAFFGALTLARLLAIPLARRLRPRQILLADLLICLAGGLVMLSFPASLPALWLGVILAGLGMASMFPTLLDLAQKYMPLTGRVTGWFFLGASSGGMIVPWLIGQFFERVGPQVVVISLLSCVCLALLIFGGLMWLRPPQAPQA